MAFLPIFLVGLFLGIGIRWTYDECRKNSPSETRIHLQEVTINSLRQDIQLLEKANEELNAKINAEKTK